MLSVRTLPGYAVRRPVIPPGAVYVGRAVARYGLRHSRWYNPFVVGRDGTQAECIAAHREWLMRGASFPSKPEPPPLEDLFELTGRDLYCWCAPDRCHADLLLRLHISECPVHESHGRRWVALPAKPQLTREGCARRDERGRIAYASILRWRDRQTSDAFSVRVIEALLERWPDAFTEMSA